MLLSPAAVPQGKNAIAIDDIPSCRMKQFSPKVEYLSLATSFPIQKNLEKLDEAIHWCKFTIHTGLQEKLVF